MNLSIEEIAYIKLSLKTIQENLCILGEQVTYLVEQQERREYARKELVKALMAKEKNEQK